MERVRILNGKLPIIIVAPHGINDERSALISEEICKNIECFGVLNLGWERSEKVDFMKDEADCNNVKHCHEDVVREEFLEPIIRFKNKILKNSKEVNLFYIHGMSNRHRVLANDPTMDIVLGYGAGKPSSVTFDVWKKNLFLDRLENMGFTTYEASEGSAMSGWSRNNMNQLFRKWYNDSRVNSIQVEIIHELRESDSSAITTGKLISEAILETSMANKFSISGYSRIY